MSPFMKFLSRVRRSSWKKRITRGDSSKSLSYEEIKARQTRLEAEMAERKPQRGSSKRNILKGRLKSLKRLLRCAADLRKRNLSEIDHIKKTMDDLEEEEKGVIAPWKARNEEELEEIRADNDLLNPLISIVIHGQQNEDQSESPVHRGRLQI